MTHTFIATPDQTQDQPPDQPEATDLVLQSTTDDDPDIRCCFRFANGKRCRLMVIDSGFGLCFQHAKLKLDRREVADLSAALLGEKPNGLHTVQQINDLLYNVIRLLAQNRISPRRATVLTYACSLLLRSAVLINR
jgi:hypothetical protein